MVRTHESTSLVLPLADLRTTWIAIGWFWGAWQRCGTGLWNVHLLEWAGPHICVQKTQTKNESMKHSWPLLREKQGDLIMDFVKCVDVARDLSKLTDCWLLNKGARTRQSFGIIRNLWSANKRKRWSCDAFSRHWVLRFGLGRPSPSLSTVTVPAQLDGGDQAGGWPFSIKVRNDKWWHETSDIDRASSSSFDNFDILQRMFCWHFYECVNKTAFDPCWYGGPCVSGGPRACVWPHGSVFLTIVTVQFE